MDKPNPPIFRTASSVDDPCINPDHGIDTPNIGSSIVTLSPFEPEKRSKTKKVDKVIPHTLKFDDLYGPPKWTKYFEIETTEI